MASRRAAANLLGRAPAHSTAALTSTPAPIRLPLSAARFVSRRHHHDQNYCYGPRSFLPAQRARQSAGLLPSQNRHQQQLSIRAGARCAAAARAYSTESGDTPSKIWDFEAMQKLTSSPDRSVVIIDVREPHELESTGRIPGAVNIPVTSAADSFHISDAEFEDRFGRPRPPRDAEVVFYCRAGVRSRAAAGLARDAGWTKVGEYPGSWLDWVEKGGKVER